MKVYERQSKDWLSLLNCIPMLTATNQHYISVFFCESFSDCFFFNISHSYCNYTDNYVILCEYFVTEWRKSFAIVVSLFTKVYARQVQTGNVAVTAVMMGCVFLWTFLLYGIIFG